MRDPGLRNQYRTELQVGALLLLSFIALVLGIGWISGARPGGDRLTVYAVAPEAAAVTEGTRVSLLGVDVGEVTRVQLQQDAVVLELIITFDGSIPRDTRGEIRTSGFLGTMVVALEPGAASEVLTVGDTIQAAAAAGLQDLAGALGTKAGDLLAQSRKLLSDTLISDMHATAGSLAAGTEHLRILLEREATALESLIEALDRAAQELAEATSGPEIDRTVANIDSLTGRLAVASDDLGASSRSLASILEKVDRGEGTLGRIVNDPGLYDRLTAATENIQVASEEIALLTRDLREQPEKYLKDLKFSVF
jgi:phospholipid/cholesterol/gamma-HCH transport system substrate-binding protein